MDVPDPVYTVELNVSNYHLLVIRDLMRMLTLQAVVQILFFLRHGDIELFSSFFVENTLFILLGLLVYWYGVNHLLRITNETTDKTDLNYYQSILI